MPKSSIATLFIMLSVSLSTSARADENTPTPSNSEPSKSSGWKDPNSSPTPTANGGDRSRDRRSALEERVRYLEEQAAIMARELDAERARRAALEAGASVAAREVDELRAKIHTERQKVHTLTLEGETSTSQRRVKNVAATLNADDNKLRPTFRLPSTLRPIKF